MTPKKNVELTDQRSESRTDNSDFKGQSKRTNRQRKLEYILLFGYIADHVEVLLSFSAIPDQVQPIFYCYYLFLMY